jgi:hypothetical protein
VEVTTSDGTFGNFYDNICHPLNDSRAPTSTSIYTSPSTGEEMGTWTNTGSRNIGGTADGITVIGGSIQKLMSGDIQGFLDLANAEVTLGAASIRRNLSVQKTIEAINAETMSKGIGSIYTGDGYENNNVIIGSNTAKLPRVPSVFKQQPSTTNNVTINVQGADPKATVDALSKYVKTNGSLPFNLQTVGKRP